MQLRHQALYEEWSRIMEEWKGTGLSGAAFCREREITCKRFYKWKHRLCSEEVPDEEGFVAMEFSEETDCSCGIDVMIGGDLRLVLAKGFDECELLRAVQVLRRSAC